jgi:hypothetical protein
MTGGALRSVAIALFAIPAIAWLGSARAQVGAEGLEVPDSVFIPVQREPLLYSTSYDLNTSRGTWTQQLNYFHNSYRASFGFDAIMNAFQPVRGLDSKGLDGSVSGRLNLRATNRWIWSVDGNFNMFSNDDKFSRTDRRQNKLQLRTQYSVNPFPQLSAVGLIYSEYQQEQSRGNHTIPGNPLQVVDTTVAPPDTTFYRSHSTRDSSYTSGRRDGIRGSFRWTPSPTLEVKGSGSGTHLGSTTRTLTRDFWALNAGQGATRRDSTRVTTHSPTGDRRFDANIAFAGIKRTNMTLALSQLDGDQGYYLLAKRQQESVSYDSRGAVFHVDHTPLPGGQISIEGSLGRSLREYQLQTLDGLIHSRSITGNFILYREASRASLGFQAGRTRNERQITQNGTIINRSMNASAGKRVTRRLWLDTTGSMSIFSRLYEDKISDRDDLRGYVNAGGGYVVSNACSTAVHFSINRSHAVAIDPKSSGGNNVQTSYQMDAVLKLQVSRTFSILQNYQINANYQIYDFDEPRNNLTRIRRIDTMLSDSIFSFAFVRLTHNFFFQDRGSYVRDAGEDQRQYSVAGRLYQQNVGVTLGVRPVRGITLSATQSLSNSRNYSPTGQGTNMNRWNMNLGGVVDRELPGGMTLNGSVQHIGEYTEMQSPLPPENVVDYWLAGVTFTKAF